MIKFATLWAIALNVAYVAAFVAVIWWCLTVDWDEVGRGLGSFAGNVVQGFQEPNQ